MTEQEQDEESWNFRGLSQDFKKPEEYFLPNNDNY